jgi:hypothetical protein
MLAWRNTTIDIQVYPPHVCDLVDHFRIDFKLECMSRFESEGPEKMCIVSRSNIGPIMACTFI